MSFQVPLFLDLEPKTNSFFDDAIHGLTQTSKSLPSKYFYDLKGSVLFDQICELPEYYPTRTELGILQEHMSHITQTLGESVILVEYGSGSSLKTQLLLKSIPDVEAYVPIDISREHLLSASEQTRMNYPNLTVLPVCADYSQQISLNLSPTPGTRVGVFFPGSTIGNFSTDHAISFLKRIHHLVGLNGGLLVGVDLLKDSSVLEAAYNDSQGVTAAFNLNMLNHANEKIGAGFDLSGFKHVAFFNSEESRIEMHLEVLRDQQIQIRDTTIHFQKGETILTEYSHKYSLEHFSETAAAAGFKVEQVCTDDQNYFSVQYLRAV